MPTVPPVVIYRQLRDFLSPHAHRAGSNTYNRNIEKPLEFPQASELKKDSEGQERCGDVSRADFARLQREALDSSRTTSSIYFVQ